ncbi:S41 family peptidase [Salinibacter grassmerensis]|uniref:S41 family peptidase n=1 Tax=Salinibacter grassmerensis TaxID=3040353 RepID=UPI0021E97B69|nr:S41 family peptidase [Salinibacter grassmerensis]
MALLSRLRRSTLVAAGLLFLVGAAALTYAYRDTLGLAEPPRDEQVENLRAFAKLYGYVRYFHPSDAAAGTDWNQFAMYGAQEVKNAASRAELRSTLEGLFRPIAPTVQLYRAGNEPPPPADVLTPSDTAGLNLVAWQHQGLGLHSDGQPYHSVRINATTDPASGGTFEDGPFAWATKQFDARRFQGKQVRLRAAVRTLDRKSTGHLYLHVPRSPNDPLSAPISSRSWSVHDRTVTVPPRASQFRAGLFVRDPGATQFDEMELLVRDSSDASWRRVSLDNAGFESGTTQWRLSDSPGVRASATTEDAFRGRQSLKLSVAPPSELQLFEAHPQPGETARKLIGRGLAAQIPLALYGRDGRTLRPDGTPSPDNLRGRLGSLETSHSGPDFSSANVVVAWNVFQHFYPYFDVVDVEWGRVLTKSLRRALTDDTPKAFQRTLQQMIARLKDGHGRVSPSPGGGSDWPILLERAGGNVVVGDTARPAGMDRSICPEIGDVVVSVDGAPIEARLRRAKRHISGSSQYRDVRALRDVEHYMDPSSVSLLLRREEKQIECSVQPRRAVPTGSMQTEPRPASFEKLSDGIYYADLTRLPWSRIQDRLDTLSEARGVVFDMRGYPEGGMQKLLPHLSPDTLRSAHFEVPKIIYPDQEEIVGYAGSRWTLPPRTPQFAGEVAFLTDARAISYAESIMGIVEQYELGTIVGQPTAGANGNVNPVSLPGGHKARWTGMRVRKHDGSQHHLVGIRPDVQVERTIEGVQSGKDEVLEKALEVLRSSERGATAPN